MSTKHSQVFGSSEQSWLSTNQGGPTAKRATHARQATDTTTAFPVTGSAVPTCSTKKRQIAKLVRRLRRIYLTAVTFEAAHVPTVASTERFVVQPVNA